MHAAHHPDRLTPDAARGEFPILQRRTYLNSCSLGALSRRAETRLGEFLQLWHEMGASAWYEHWLARLDELRTRVAGFWGSQPGAVALLPSVSAALSVVASALEGGATPGAPSAARRRRRVVTTELDFPTLVYQWRVRPEMELVVLPSPDGVRVDPEQFDAAVDERTLCIATSHVFFATGYVQDLPELARIAHDAGAWCVVDGYQGLGQVPLDVTEAGVDVYIAGPLKWMCGGPGLAYLYVRGDRIGRLEPRITSWFAAARQFDFDVHAFEFRADARRFELGTPALPTVHTALGGHEVVAEVGIDAVTARNRLLTEALVEACRDAGLELSLPAEPKRSAIVMVRHADPAGAVRHLAAHDVIVDHRPGHVRISPHFYNTPEEVRRCVELLAGV